MNPSTSESRSMRRRSLYATGWKIHQRRARITSATAALRAELMRLVLLFYQLVEQIEEVGCALVADVVDVPQSRLADLGAGGVVAEPAGAGRSSPSARHEVRAMLLRST